MVFSLVFFSLFCWCPLVSSQKIGEFLNLHISVCRLTPSVVSHQAMKQHHLVSFCQLLLVYRTNKNNVTVAGFEKYCNLSCWFFHSFTGQSVTCTKDSAGPCVLENPRKNSNASPVENPWNCVGQGSSAQGCYLSWFSYPVFTKETLKPFKTLTISFSLIRNVCMCRLYCFYPVNRHHQGHFFQMFILP